ncbi:MAG: ABC transporter permease [Halanaerobiales bacterium]
MKLVYRLALRNLLRQKKRNFLLGTCIAIGMMILVIANSFSHGLVDVLINDIVSYAYGHLVVEGNPGTMYTMINDKERIEEIIRDTVPEDDLIYLAENLGIYAQAVSNGEADNLMIIGIDTEEYSDEFFADFFTLVEGDFKEYFNKEIEHPIIISEAKAKSLNVGLYDTIKVRFQTVTGQMQSAKLTITTIANAGNSFMDIVAFLDAAHVKELAGYKSWQSPSLQLNLNNPKSTSKMYADLLHEKLQPEIISIIGTIGAEEARLLAYKNTDSDIAVIEQSIELVDGDQEEAFSKDGVMISSLLAGKLGLKPGDSIDYQYQTKYRGSFTEKFIIDAIYTTDNELGSNVILLNEERIHDTYNDYLPADSDWNYIAENNILYEAMATEWKLMERSADSQELQKRYREQRSINSDQSILNTVSMYEGASDILMLEDVLNMVTLIAVMILFFIILIGVINTLRMTIKERTREIGTVRAIGMQKKDVRNQFIMETFLLTFFACLMGVVIGIILMYGLSAIELSVDNALSMILKDGHLNFKINPISIGINFLLILMIAVLTAYFPARKAANMSAVDALRHYE